MTKTTPEWAANAPGYQTHEVLNQPRRLAGYNAFSADAALTSAVGAFGAGWAGESLAACGATVASARVQDLARLANRHTPELKTHDRFGHRIDEVEFHPAYHELMGLIFAAETHSLGWTAKRPGAQVARGALSYLWSQGESGVTCPMAMTFASLPALAHDPAQQAALAPKILANTYDPRPLPHEQKSALAVAMAMTEKQGGSDLRAIQTSARPASEQRGSGAPYLITGHKWFFSAPMSDLFLTLARTDAGITCFLAPGWLPDGARNRLKIQRLKEKCGNRSNASSEVEFHDLYAIMLGEDGRGIATILDMAHMTRLECALSSAGLMRQAVTYAIHHASERRAFQRPLIDQPLMANVLADLAVEAEAALWLAMRVAAAADRASSDPAQTLLGRLATPIAKYWNCKRVTPVVAEALECHGGGGFIEEGPMARLYREAPLNGIWEGSGNVICLDVLRAMGKEPASVTAFLDEVRVAKGSDRRFDAHIARLEQRLANPRDLEPEARLVIEDMALALAGSLLLRHSTPAVADAFIASRFGDDRHACFGTLGAAAATRAIIDRARIAG